MPLIFARPVVAHANFVLISLFYVDFIRHPASTIATLEPPLNQHDAKSKLSTQALAVTEQQRE